MSMLVYVSSEKEDQDLVRRDASNRMRDRYMVCWRVLKLNFDRGRVVDTNNLWINRLKFQTNELERKSHISYKVEIEQGAHVYKGPALAHHLFDVCPTRPNDGPDSRVWNADLERLARRSGRSHHSDPRPRLHRARINRRAVVKVLLLLNDK